MSREKNPIPITKDALAERFGYLPRSYATLYLAWITGGLSAEKLSRIAEAHYIADNKNPLPLSEVLKNLRIRKVRVSDKSTLDPFLNSVGVRYSREEMEYKFDPSKPVPFYDQGTIFNQQAGEGSARAMRLELLGLNSVGEIMYTHQNGIESFKITTRGIQRTNNLRQMFSDLRPELAGRKVILTGNNLGQFEVI